jgi:hypothetical protein
MACENPSGFTTPYLAHLAGKTYVSLDTSGVLWPLDPRKDGDNRNPREDAQSNAMSAGTEPPRGMGAASFQRIHTGEEPHGNHHIFISDPFFLDAVLFSLTQLRSEHSTPAQ